MLQTKTLALFLLFFISCQKERSFYSFFNELFPLAFHSTHIEIYSENLFSAEVISLPKNTWVDLVMFEKRNERFCLLYKTPYKNKEQELDGVLRLIKIQNKEDCNELNQKNLQAQVSLKYLSVEFMTKNEDGSFRPQMIFMGEYKENKKLKNFKLTLPLLSLKYGANTFSQGKKLDGPSLYQKFSSSVDLTYLHGLSFNRFDNNNPVAKNFKFVEANFCHKLDESCLNREDYKCSLCPHGLWTEIAGGKCSTRLDKVCGDYQCNQAGNPACFRGFSFTNEKLVGCERFQNAVYCLEGLKPICVDGYFICQ